MLRLHASPLDDRPSTTLANNRLRGRRAVSYRLPPLTDGRRDPHDPAPDGVPMRPDATAATILHLRALGYVWVPVQRSDLQAMWRAGGACQRIAVEQAECNARWSA